MWRISKAWPLCESRLKSVWACSGGCLSACPAEHQPGMLLKRPEKSLMRLRRRWQLGVSVWGNRWTLTRARFRPRQIWTGRSAAGCFCAAANAALERFLYPCRWRQVDLWGRNAITTAALASVRLGKASFASVQTLQLHNSQVWGSGGVWEGPGSLRQMLG